jgi:hypothetical protein
MSRLRKGAIPTYRLHKARNCAVVTIDGRDHYLGPFDSPSSKQKYAPLIGTWRQLQEQSEEPAAEVDTPLVLNDRPTAACKPSWTGSKNLPVLVESRRASRRRILCSWRCWIARTRPIPFGAAVA